jgi:hypothetical protein
MKVAKSNGAEIVPALRLSHLQSRLTPKNIKMSSTVTETVNLPTRVVAVQEDYAPSPPPGENDAQYQAIARGNRAGTLKLRGIPLYTDLYAKRQWMKEHMAAAFRFFGKQNYGMGVSGHISMRGASNSNAQPHTGTTNRDIQTPSLRNTSGSTLWPSTSQ